MAWFCICVVSFLIGGIPFGYVLGRWILQDDIRKHGSGNIGATNVARVVGWKWGGVVLVLDALKGFLPTWGSLRYVETCGPETQRSLIMVSAAICAIIGHMYPVYLRLRGGKGVATALGAILVLAPAALGIAAVAFAVVVAATRLVALGSITAAIAFGSAQLYFMRGHLWDPGDVPMTAFAITIPLLIIWRHRSNIARLLTGTEPPVTESAAPAEDVDAGE